MLPADAVAALESHAPTIQQAFESKQVYRTETEMRVSVLNDLKYSTLEAKYWQAVREEDVHFNELVTLSFSYRRVQLEVEQIERELKKLDADGDTQPEVMSIQNPGGTNEIRLDKDLVKDKLQIDLEEKVFQLKQMQLVAKHRHREIMTWEKIRDEIRKSNPNMNVDDPNVHQLFSYAMRFTNELLAAIKSGTKTNPSEMINIEGKFKSAVNRIGPKVFAEEVIKLFPQEDQELIRPYLPRAA